MMMRPGDILGRIFFILSQKSIIGIYPRNTRIIGSSEFKRMLNGYFLGGCFARNLWRKSFMRCCFARNNSIQLASINIIFNYNL